MPSAPLKALPPALLRDLTAVVGGPHVLTGDAAAGYAVDWTGRFRGDPPAVVRPRDTAQVAAVLALCSGAGVPVVPQGGNTGLVGGGVPSTGKSCSAWPGWTGSASPTWRRRRSRRGPG